MWISQRIRYFSVLLLLSFWYIVKMRTDRMLAVIVWFLLSADGWLVVCFVSFCFVGRHFLSQFHLENHGLFVGNVVCSAVIKYIEWNWHTFFPILEQKKRPNYCYTIRKSTKNQTIWDLHTFMLMIFYSSVLRYIFRTLFAMD